MMIPCHRPQPTSSRRSLCAVFAWPRRISWNLRSDPPVEDLEEPPNGLDNWVHCEMQDG
jgi:hypothetical protein